MILEHLMFGSEYYGTLKTACGLTIEKRGDYYVAGSNGMNTCWREKHYLKIRLKIRTCARCEKALTKVFRDRSQKLEPGYNQRNP